MRKKCITFLYSLSPLFMWLLLQQVFLAGFTPVVHALLQTLESSGKDMLLIREYLSKEYTYIVSSVINLVTLLLGLLWLSALQRGQGKRKHTAQFTVKSCVWLLVLGLALQFGVDMLLTFLAVTFPQSMESYYGVMENLGMFSPSLFSMLYSVVMAPLTEELLFRGLTLQLLEKDFPFWAANLLQALYFGVVHGNVVQGSYAFVMGLVLGGLTRRYGTLKAAVFCHFVINLSGNLIGSYISMEFLVALILVLVLILAGVGTLGRDNKYSKKQKKG